MSDFSAESRVGQEAPERKLVKVVSDFEDETGTHPEITLDPNAAGLFLFDIDGTLVDAKKIHGPSVISLYKAKFPEDPRFSDPDFQQAFQEYYFSNFGKGERPEQQMLCEQFGFSFNDDFLDELAKDYGDHFAQILQNSTKEQRANMVLPGVVKFLENLHRNKMPVAIVTGNVKESGQAVLKYLGLSKYFIAGGFDDDVSKDPGPLTRRAYILKSAIEKLKQKGVFLVKNEKMIVGDTPKDFNATVENGHKSAMTLLVSTGDYSLEELDQVQANLVKPDLVIPELHLTSDQQKNVELLKRITDHD